LGSSKILWERVALDLMSKRSKRKRALQRPASTTQPLPKEILSTPQPTTASARLGVHLKRLWQDPVWSKVIAAGITAVLAYVLVVGPQRGDLGRANALVERAKASEPIPLDLRNRWEFQTGFAAVEGSSSFKWGGVYSLTNTSDSALTITGFDISWPSGPELLLETRDPEIDIIDDAASLSAFVMEKKLGTGVHQGEHLPLSIPSHTTRHFIFNYIIRILQGGEQVTFSTDDEGYRLLARALLLPPPPYSCDLDRRLPIKISLSNGIVRQYNVSTWFIAAGCTVKVGLWGGPRIEERSPLKSRPTQ
jgi:hypothetical protein